MENIVTVINELNEAIEIKIQEYLISGDAQNAPSFEPPVYSPLEEDFSIYYPKPKPFQRVIGTINYIKQP
ncbi:hypothetical protein [Ferruginibacter sp.]|nr:hypothetical protein [Ferruginibacter sp.]